MERKISQQVRGFRTKDGAGVNLVRVLGNQTVEEYDPILMLDSFDSINPDDYTAGFPMHLHRGIETISYVLHLCNESGRGSCEALSGSIRKP